MDRCLLCGHDPAAHHPDCPDHADGAVDDGAPAGTPPPWSIPIREPRVQRSASAADVSATDEREHRRLVAVVAAAGVLLLALIAGAVLMDGGVADSGAGDADTAVAGSEVDRVPATEPVSPSTEDETTTTAETTTTTASTSTTTTAPPPETSAVAADTGDVPILAPGVIGRGWVAQVSSVPMSAGGSALQTAYETVQADAPSAVAIRSDEWPALRDGFWVIVIPDFDSGPAAVAGCEAAGRTDGDSCFGRFLSAQRDQNQWVCRRADDGALAGDCDA